MKKSILDAAPETLEQAIRSMEEKILDLMDEFKDAPLEYEAKMSDGRWIRRANPFVQEYRALVKDYASAVKAYRDLTDGKEPAGVSSLDELRARLKVVK